MTTPQLFTIDHCHAGQRLDKALGELVSGLGTRGAKRFAINGQVTVNGKPSRPNNRLEEGDIIAFEETKIKISTQARLLERDSNFLFLFKPRNMYCVSIPGSAVYSLEDFLPQILHDNKISGEARLQRLDYGTSGIVLATTQHTEQNEFLISQREGKCQKLYLALLSGLLHQQKIVKNALATDKRKKSKILSKEAAPIRQTIITPIQVWEKPADLSEEFSAFFTEKQVCEFAENGLTLAVCEIKKGARHQIRAHAAHIGHPLAGDCLYNPGFSGETNFFLHQTRLSFNAHSCLCLPQWLPLSIKPATLNWIKEEYNF